MKTESIQYYDKFVEHLNGVSDKLKNINNPNIEEAISCWINSIKGLNLDIAESKANSVYGATVFKDVSCRFYQEIILSCDVDIDFKPSDESFRSSGRFLGKLGKVAINFFNLLKTNLDKLHTSDIEDIFKNSIDNCNKSKNQNYLAFLGFICIAISYPYPNQFTKTFKNTHISSENIDFQEISKQYFKEINSYEDTYFDLVYDVLINDLDCFDAFFKALVIETSKQIRLFNQTLTDNDVKSIKVNIVLGKRLITEKFNPLLKNNPKSEVSFMDKQDIQKIALIFALVVGSILTIGGATYLYTKNKTPAKPKPSTKDPTPTPLPISKRTPHILVLMLDGTDSVKKAVDYIWTDTRSTKLDTVTVSAISKLTVLQAIWHGSMDEYASSLKEILNSRGYKSDDNLIFIEIEMDYREYDFDEGAGLSNARDGLMKLVKNSNSYKISNIVTRSASDSDLKTKISSLYR